MTNWKSWIQIIVLGLLLAVFYATPAIGATSISYTEDSPAVAPLAGIVALASTGDTVLQEAHPTTNYDSAKSLTLGRKDGGRSRGLIEFNLGEIPRGAVINSATLRIFQHGWNDIPGSVRTISVDRVTSAWHEAVGTWNCAPTMNATVGTVNVGLSMGWYEVNVTTLVQEWYTGATPNYGFLLRGDESSGNLYRLFTPRLYPNAPQLVVNYTLQPATLAVSTNAISFTTNGQTTDPSSFILHIKNNGTGTVNWSINTGSTSWLSISSTSGSTTASYQTPIELSIRSDLLSSGIHTAQITVTAPGAQNSPQIVNVTVNYNEAALNQVYLPLILGKSAAGVTSITPSSTTLSNTVALLIGIADYDHLGPPSLADFRSGDWGSDLEHADEDPQHIHEALVAFEDQTDNMQIVTEDDNIRIVTEPEASFSQLENLVEGWLDNREKEPDQPVMISYSGHGGPDGQGGYFVAAQDTNDAGGIFTNHVSSTTLDTWLDNLESQQIVVMIDACYSEIALAALGQPGRVVIVASRSNQPSWETSEFKGGVFTHYIVQGLLDPAADINGNGYISVEEAYTYAAGRTDTYIFSSDLGLHQNPQIYDGFPGELSLVTAPSCKPMSASATLVTSNEINESKAEYFSAEPVALPVKIGPIQ
jgi:hypothetical protein